MEDEKNYRGTGLSKQEIQRRVDKVIEQFKLDNPGKEVPSSLTNWVSNIATDEDVRIARERMEDLFEKHFDSTSFKE